MIDTLLIELLHRLDPARMSRFALAAAEPLVALASAGPTEPRLRSSMGKRWPGSIDSLATRARDATTESDKREIIADLGRLERAAGKLRTELRDARILEKAAYVLAHALGVTIHGNVRSVAELAHDGPRTAMIQFVLDREYGLPAPKGSPPVLIPGSEFARVEQHPWLVAERERQHAIARALVAGADEAPVIASRFAQEVLASE